MAQVNDGNSQPVKVEDNEFVDLDFLKVQDEAERLTLERLGKDLKEKQEAEKREREEYLQSRENRTKAEDVQEATAAIKKGK